VTGVPDEVFRFPTDTEHVAIFGRNGSGKTQFACWLLSERSFDRMPWIVLNFKGDDLIEEIAGARPMAVTDAIPSKPGIYVCSALVTDKEDQEKLDGLFQRCWAKENVGIYVDEGYMASGLKWFRACMSQGRSKHVPLIILSQRPVWMDRFVWSEASLFVAFDLNLQDDKDTADRMIPGYRKVTLPAFHSVFHDVKANQSAILTPAPDRETILQRFRSRMRIRMKAL
jgi:hypothetical protein